MDKIAEKIGQLQTSFNKIADFHNQIIDLLAEAKTESRNWHKAMDELVILAEKRLEKRK